MRFLVAQTGENLPAMQETRVRSLGWEDPLEEDMATPSSIHAWRIPRAEESGGLLSMELQNFSESVGGGRGQRCCWAWQKGTLPALAKTRQMESRHTRAHSLPGAASALGTRSLSGESQCPYHATKRHMRSTLRGHSILTTP